MHVSRSVCCTTEGVKHVWNTEALSTVKKSREQLPDPHGPLNTDGKVPSSVLTQASDKSDTANSSSGSRRGHYLHLTASESFGFPSSRVLLPKWLNSPSHARLEFSQISLYMWYPRIIEFTVKV